MQEIHSKVLPHIKSPVIAPLLIPQKALLNLVLPPPMKGISLSLEITSMTPVAMLVAAFERHMKEHNIRLESTLPHDKVQVTVGTIVFGLDDLLGVHSFPFHATTWPCLSSQTTLLRCRSQECNPFATSNATLISGTTASL